MVEAPRTVTHAVFALCGAILPSLLVAQDSLRELKQREQAIRHEHATAFIGLVERFSADVALRGHTRSPRRTARLLDASVGLNVKLLPHGKNSTSSNLRFHIIQTVSAIDQGLLIDNQAIAKLTQLHPLIGALACQHHEAAIALKPVVDGYRKLGDVDEAFALAGICQRLSFYDIRDTYRELSEQLARTRYEQTTKLHIEAFRKKNAKIGKSKSWKFDGMTIRGPKPHAANAALISKTEPPTAFSMQADVLGASNRNAIVFVTSWIDSKNFVGVEFDGQSIRILRVDRDKRRVLAESTVRRMPGQYHPLEITFADDKLTASGGSDFPPVSAAAPPPGRGKFRYGLLQPGLGRKPGKTDKQRTVQVRNFMIAAKR